MAKRTGTRARRIIGLATERINRGGRGPSSEERSRAARRALELRWAQQRRCLDLAPDDH